MSRRSMSAVTIPSHRRAPEPPPEPAVRLLDPALLVTAAVPMLALGAVLQWQFDRPPALALVASLAAVALPLRRLLPAVVATACALFLCVSVWLGGLLLLGLSGASQPLHPAWALGVLLLPCFAWCAELLPSVRRARGVREEGTELAPMLLLGAMTGGVVMLLAVLAAGISRPFADVAWALGGDARNQLLVSRGILELGGLDRVALSKYPGLSNGVLALLVDTRHRTTIAPAEVLLLDFRGLSQLAALSVVAWCTAAAGLVSAVAPLRRRRQALALAAASLLPLTGVGLGVALRDGFHSAIFSMPLLTSALLLATWAVRQRPRRVAAVVVCGSLGAALPASAMSWSPLLPVVGLVVLPAVLLVCRSNARNWAVGAFAAAATGALAGALLLLPLLSSPVTGSISANGSISAPTPVVFAVVPLLVAALALSGMRGVVPAVFVPYAAGTAGAALVVTYAVSQQTGTAWNYYPAKLSWLWILAGLPLLLVAAAHRSAVDEAGASAAARRNGLAVVAILSVAALALASSFGRVSSPLLAVPRLAGLGVGALTPGGTRSLPEGWSQPDADTVAKVLELGRGGARPVFWSFRDPGEDRLGNFWLSSYDPLSDLNGSVPLSPFAAWAYTYDPADLAQLCAILASEPDRVVVTRDAAVEVGLGTQCGVPESRVDVQSTPSAPGSP